MAWKDACAAHDQELAVCCGRLSWAESQRGVPPPRTLYAECPDLSVSHCVLGYSTQIYTALLRDVPSTSVKVKADVRAG